MSRWGGRVGGYERMWEVNDGEILKYLWERPYLLKSQIIWGHLMCVNIVWSLAGKGKYLLTAKLISNITLSGRCMPKRLEWTVLVWQIPVYFTECTLFVFCVSMFHFHYSFIILRVNVVVIMTLILEVIMISWAPYLLHVIQLTHSPLPECGNLCILWPINTSFQWFSPWDTWRHGYTYI